MRRRGGQLGCLLLAEAGGRDAEVCAPRRVDPPDAGAPLCHVQIELQDPVLGQDELEPERGGRLRLELVLSKDRILELYLNVAEWGPGIWGIDAARRAYFGVPASRLSEEQAAELAATPPHPRTSNPTFRPDRMLGRRNLILARYRGVDVYIPPAEETDSLPIPLPAPVVPPALDSLRIDVPVDSLEDSLTDRRTDAQRRTEDSVRDGLP